MTNIKRSARLLPALVIAATLAVGVTACGTQGSGAPKDGPKTATAYDWNLAFAKCMRDAGLDYPDPEPGSSGPTKVKVDDEEAFEKARESCTKTVTASKGKEPVSEEARKWNDIYAPEIDCLRKKGYEVKTSQGGYTIEGGEVSETDMKECRSDEHESIEIPK